MLNANGSRRELHLENSWPHKQRLVFKFEGIDSISDAETLIGGEIQIPAEQRADLEQGAAYISDLVGCQVFVAGKGEIGAVSDVSFGAGEAPILEIREANKEYLIPFAQAYIRSIDTTAKRIELQLPEGMLELDAPLSKSEKNVQHQSEK